MSEKKLLELCDGLVESARRSGADEAEAIAGWSRRVETALENDDLHTALERFLGSGLRELPVMEDGRVVGLLDESHITRAYHDYLAKLGEEVDSRLSVVPSSSKIPAPKVAKSE